MDDSTIKAFLKVQEKYCITNPDDFFNIDSDNGQYILSILTDESSDIFLP